MENVAKNIRRNNLPQGQATENRIEPDAPAFNGSKANVAKDDPLKGTT
jgi:hypothetical protein